MALRPDWRLPLRRPAIKPNVFTRLMQGAILELVPGATVTPGGEFELAVILPNELELQVWLGNLFGNLPDEFEARIGEIEHFVKTLASTPAGDDVPPPSIESIVPQIKDSRFIAEVSRLSEGKHPPLLFESLVADLYVLYACDSERAIMPLREDELPVIGISGGDLRATAIENLRRILPPIRAEQNDFGGMLVCGGTYEASILLLDKVWAQIEEQYSGPVLACVPARDMLLFGNSDDPRALEMIQEVAAEVEQGGSYLISQTVLVRRYGRWEEFRPDAPPT